MSDTPGTIRPIRLRDKDVVITRATWPRLRSILGEAFDLNMPDVYPAADPPPGHPTDCEFMGHIFFGPFDFLGRFHACAWCGAVASTIRGKV